MDELPRALKAGIWAAWTFAGLELVGMLWDPWHLLSVILWALAARGLSKLKAWSGYGPALMQCALVGFLCYLFAADPAAVSQLGWKAALGLGLTTLIGFLLFRAGRAAETVSGRRSGSPWGWIALSSAMTVFLIAFKPMVVPTGAMEKTALIGDHILVRNAPGVSPARRDIVVFRYPVDPSQIFIKRVVGLPGDNIRIKDKKLFVNGAAQEEPYAFHATDYTDSYRDNFPSEPNVRLYPHADDMLRDSVGAGQVMIPRGKYFVLGDNRDSSLDSRYWGFLDAADIIGEPWIVYYSADVSSKQVADGGWGITINRLRWDRFFKRLR